MDVDRNGALDRLYFADTGGKVWRVDFDGPLTGTDSKKAKLKLFADLGGAAPKRKFFTEPDVALFKHNGNYLISVAIGSGQRPKPLDATTDDHFFVMFDQNIVKSPTNLTATITRGDLKDATPGPVSNIFVDGKNGWYLDLVAVGAEKVLSRATTYKNMVLFNSFGVKSVTASLCGVDNVNQSRLYALDLMTGGAALDLDDSGTIVKTDANDRSKKIADGEIPEAPQIVFDDPTAVDGTACVVGNCIRRDGVISGKAPRQALPPVQRLRKAFWIDK
jgi:Tfp pilus tip-associated adhesin PilY1